MKNFRDLQKKHEIFLKSKQAGEDIVKEVESYIELTINSGQDITDSFQREQLRANNRYWGNYVYEKTGTFPKTDIDPPSEKALLRRKFIVWSKRGLTLLIFSITTIVLYQFFLFHLPHYRLQNQCVARRKRPT